MAKNRSAETAAPTVSIRKTALLSALQGAKNMHPDEFIALFRGENAADGQLVLTELIIPPFATGDEDSSSYSPYFIPANSREKASFHSHPDPDTAYPSDEDLYYFSKESGIHFIACWPFRLQDVACFDADGIEIAFTIV
ncbi:hypothetical protein HYV43_00085 [Candidatus Micrarchaeota archaeon]|nr:hypothetical protein [Candidatus Micrarchaeota archaeon]